MKQDDKNIDKLFKTVLAEHEITPPAYIWDDINSQLDNHKKQRIIIWWRSIAASIALMLAFGAGYFISKHNITTQNYVASNSTQPKQTNIIDSNYITENGIIIYNNSYNVTTTNRTETTVNNQAQVSKTFDHQTIDTNKVIPLENTLQTYIDISKTDVKNNITVFQNQDNLIKKIEQYIEEAEILNLQSPTNNTLSDVELITLEEPKLRSPLDSTLLVQEKEPMTILSAEKNRWVLRGEFSPLYAFNASSNTQNINRPATQMPLTAKDFNTQQEALLSFLGGLSIEYKTPSRWSVASGVYYAQKGQIVDNLAINEDAGERPKQYTTSTPSLSAEFATQSNDRMQNIIRDEGYVGIQIEGQDKLKVYQPDLELTQNFELIEVPITIKYKLIDQKIDLNVLSGVNANFVVGNNAYINYGSENLWTGETPDLHPISYGASIGLELEYEFSQKLYLNISPNYKYAITPLNQSGSVYPYPNSLGIFTGLNFKF